MQAASKFFLLIFDQGCRPIWRTIIDNQDVKIMGQGEYSVNHFHNVLFLVVGRNDYEAVAQDV